MKKIFLFLFLFYFANNSVFGQSKKYYTISPTSKETSFSDEYLISFDNVQLKIDIAYKIGNYYYFTLNQDKNNEVFKINKDSVLITAKNLINMSSTNKNVGFALGKFAKQQKTSIFVGLIGGGLGAIGILNNNKALAISGSVLAIVSFFIHLGSYKHLIAYSKIESAIKYATEFNKETFKNSF